MDDMATPGLDAVDEVSFAHTKQTRLRSPHQVQFQSQCAPLKTTSTLSMHKERQQQSSSPFSGIRVPPWTCHRRETPIFPSGTASSGPGLVSGHLSVRAD